MGITINDDRHALAGADLLGTTTALSAGMPTVVVEKELLKFFEDQGLNFELIENPQPDAVAVSIKDALEKLSSQEIGGTISASFETAADRPAELAIGALAIGGGTLVAMGILSKLEYKDGKWSMASGFPGFEHVASIFQSIAKITSG